MINNKKISLFAIGVTSLAALYGQETKRPNIIYIFPDQMRNHAMEFWNDPGFREHVNFQADPVYTPVLNKFARESVVLSAAHSNCPLSSPYRGMMLTGMYPDGSGVPLNCNTTRPISSLRDEAITISDVLAEQGYDCGYIGKLHLNFPTKNNPQNPGTYVENVTPVWDAYTPPEKRHGFRYWYSYGTFNVHKEPHYWDTNGYRHEIREWSPKHEADKAIEFLTKDRDQDKPFYLVISMNPPHSPYMSLDDVMEEDYNLYKDKSLEELLIRPNVQDSLAHKQLAAPYYFASVTGVDREFGRILDALKELGLEENTMIIFTSDHGETMASHVEDPKNSPYTESMNVPFLVRYPNVLKPHVNDLLLGTPDIMPTILGFVGLEDEIPATVQGENLSDFFKLKGKKRHAPKAVLYIRNVDGEKDANGIVQNYFPIARGVKTARHTMAITVNRKNELREVLLFDDKKDPYQLNSLNYKKEKRLFKKLTKIMVGEMKKANDPWYRDSVLSDLIPYD